MTIVKRLMTLPTRTRILDAALVLFAENGYRGTSVGQIEAAAGLTERGGAAYKHFRSKTEILHAALERQIEQIIEMRSTVANLLPLGDARADLVLLARWILAELRREELINALMEKESDSVEGLREQFRDRVVEPGYAAAAQILHDRLDALGLDPSTDTDALAAVTVGALVNYRRHQWTFGTPPLGVDEQRYVEALVGMIGPRRR
jgi:AcrR family transcriptional regulator